MKKAILKTLCYADIFDYPLKAPEVWRFLISQVKTKEKDVQAALTQMSADSKQIDADNKYFFLRGRKEIVKTRRKRKAWSCPKIKHAEKVAGILRKIPWIKLVGITGGLARKNSDSKDDIDLFFITQRNRLWLSRGFVVLILRFLGAYRRPQKVKDMICPNMFVSEDNLEMGPHDLFTAHEICLMKPIFVRGNAQTKFLQANLWVERFLPNVYRGLTQNKNAERHRISVDQFKNQRSSAFERRARDFQLWYMQKKKTTEVVSENLIKFHPQDARSWVLEEYQKRLDKLGLIC